MTNGWQEEPVGQTVRGPEPAWRRQWLLAGLCGASLLAGQARAEAPTAQAGGDAEGRPSDGDILVTAQRRAQTAASLGIAITAIPGEVLIERGIATAEQLWRITPGLVVKDAGYGVPNYTLRGVGFENYFVNSSSTVGLYANEIAIPYPVMSRGAFFDLERVEVLKGPQGDLYGRNTTAGQINLIDRKPTRELAAGGTIEVGRFHSIEGQGYLSGPLAPGVQARLSAVVRTSDGWQRSLSRADDRLLGGKDEIGLRGQVSIDIGPDGSLLLRAYRNRDQSDNLALTPVDGRTLGLPRAQAGGPVGTTRFSTGDNRSADWSPAFRPGRDNVGKGVSGTLEVPVAGVRLSVVSAYDTFHRNETNDFDGSAINDSNAANTSRINAFSQEVRLASRSGDDALQWIVGGYYSYDKVREDYRFFMPDSFFGTVLDIDALNTRYRQTTRSRAGFGHAEAKLTDRLRLTGGLRYTSETRRFAGCTYDLDGSLTRFVNTTLIPRVITPLRLPVPGPIGPGGCSVYDDRRDSPTYGTFADAEERAHTGRWLWKGGAQLDAGDGVLVYANVSSGFKSGGFNGANANLKSQQSNYRPETLTAYEAGAKANLRDVGLYLEGSVFYYDYRNKQTNGTAVTFVGNITGITNIPRSRVLGAEATMRWAAFRGASIQASGTWLDSKIRRWQPVSPLSAFPNIVTTNAAGLPLPNAPRWSLTVTPSYTLDVGGSRTVKLAVDYYYRSRTYGVGNVFQEIPGYGLVDAELSFGPRDDRWRVTAWGRNVFDKYYYNYAGLPGNSNYVRGVGLPATYGLRLGFAL